MNLGEIKKSYMTSTLSYGKLAYNNLEKSTKIK